METQVLTEEEISKIQNLKQEFADLKEILGNIEVQLLNLKLQKSNLKEQLQSLLTQEVNLTQELEKKYGRGTISLETKEFFPTS